MFPKTLKHFSLKPSKRLTNGAILNGHILIFKMNSTTSILAQLGRTEWEGATDRHLSSNNMSNKSKQEIE